MGFLSIAGKCVAFFVVLLAALVGLTLNGTLSRWGVWCRLPAVVPQLVGMGPAFMSPEEAASQWNYTDLPDGVLVGKTAVVTGANIGLGYFTALHLALKGAHVVMACRTVSKCEQSAKSIQEQLKSIGSVETMHIDTSSLASVDTFSKELRSKLHRLDILVCNAGIGFGMGLSEDGIEKIFATNHLGHFLLFKNVREVMEATASDHGEARVVHVSSAAHFGVDSIFNNLVDLNTKLKHTDKYGHSKLCNILFSNEISAQMKVKDVNILSNSVHPGAVNTNIWTHLIAYVHRSLPTMLVPKTVELINYVRDEAFWTSEQGARTQVYLAASPEIKSEGITGKYYHPVTVQLQPSDAANNVEMQQALWKFSEALLAEKGF